MHTHDDFILEFTNNKFKNEKKKHGFSKNEKFNNN